ncbi:ATP-binding protein [Massilia sp. MB5]|uniref:sensor histidine kinase n=1 Tax=Massilia sp. MB5 TaxID=2919578 RepID=UPI0027D95388|nr:ATP-binding protein [Massilia sp. MB5]
MFSILPALVSLLFLAYGSYVLHSRGANRASLTFFLVCATTSLWQAAWSLLFQTDASALALILARFGYVPILFLPTTLYHFITELTRQPGEGRWVMTSYGLAAVLSVFTVSTDWFVSGLHAYFFGYYPRAGWLHPLHLLQTAVVMLRGLYLLYRRQQAAMSTERARLRYCLVSVLIYFSAAIDYLCNYGYEFYPPGVLSLAASLGLIAQAMVQHNLLADPMAAAASIAHEMRTPLATIRSQSRLLAKSLPELIAGYQSLTQQRAHQPRLNAEQLQYLGGLAQHIEQEVSRSNFIVDMLLASATAENFRRDEFRNYSIKACVDEALSCYPFEEGMRERVSAQVRHDFRFHGSDVLLIYVLYNLLKNSLHAIRTGSLGQGTVEVECFSLARHNWLVVTDTGPGIAADVLPHVFEPYYTTRRQGGGAGMGLAFCQRVLSAFGGAIRCESVPGRFTRFSLTFPPCVPQGTPVTAVEVCAPLAGEQARRA